MVYPLSTTVLAITDLLFSCSDDTMLHWGKNCNYAFNETKGKYSKLGKFSDMKGQVRPGRRLLN
jgi:hypothetical protein